jgi:hypothetical protein
MTPTVTRQTILIRPVGGSDDTGTWDEFPLDDQAEARVLDRWPDAEIRGQVAISRATYKQAPSVIGADLTPICRQQVEGEIRSRMSQHPVQVASIRSYYV